MPDALDVSRYELPVAALIDAIELTEAASKWVKLQSARERAVAALKRRRAELNALYERAVAPDTGWQEITEVAAMMGEWGALRQRSSILRLTRFGENSPPRVATFPRRSDERARKASKLPRVG